MQQATSAGQTSEGAAGQSAPAATDPATIAAGAVKGISHIATLPEITLSIIELVEHPSSTAQDLNKVISKDPALCSRILKVVNSAFYGLPRQIGSINRTISLLGLNAVKNLASAASLAKLFKGGALCNRFDARDLWTHSVATATISKLIATSLKVNFADEAFLAGLIHDIGIMVELQADRNKLIEVLNKIKPNTDGVPSGDMRAVEREIFGADHQAFGRGLCERWKFPKAFAQVTGWHHNPLDQPAGGRTLAAIVHCADLMAGSVKHGFRLDNPSLEPDGSVLDEIKLTREKFNELRDSLPDAMSDVEGMLT
jgi:HD-like signal output (HDOD) protein